MKKNLTIFILTLLPLTEKARRADEVVDNTGTLEQLRYRVEELFIRLRNGTSHLPEND